VPSRRPDFSRLLSVPLWELATLPLRKIRVAVLDTGIDSSHPALRARVPRAVAYRKFQDDAIVSCPLPRRTNNDPAGHGTGVAGIIAALAPNTVLHDYRVLDADSSGFGDVVLRGLADAIASDADVINISIAISKDRWWAATSRLLEDARDRGKIVVAAKRNFPRPGDLGIPAELPAAISVDAASFPSPFLLRHFPRSPIPFAAHGHAVLTARPGGGWTRLTGTSFAAPVVSALCALLLGANPTLELFELKTLLKHHASARFRAAPPTTPSRHPPVKP
jgi:subtilisin family serine protease